jgi:hypothetical protein
MENAMFFDILAPIGKMRNIHGLQRSFLIMKNTHSKDRDRDRQRQSVSE